jgi:ferredoxin-type protein NapH
MDRQDKINIPRFSSSPRIRVSASSLLRVPLSRLRRFVLLGIIVLFLLQFLRVKVLVGGLSGSLVGWFVKLIDVFAYLESLIASKDFTISALIAVLPVLAIYLIFGRAFCGWVCPMDFLFEMVDRIKIRSEEQKSRRVKERKRDFADRISPKLGYAIAGVLLGVSALIEIPFFTNYISHLTNFFRLLTGSVFLSFKFPVEPAVLIYSGGLITMLLVLEYFFPRLWCRVLCPVGKTYGLFNKVSLLKLKFVEGECGECNLCDSMCYMNVKIAENIDQPGLRDINCIYCGRCVEGCETKGKLIKMKLSPLSFRAKRGISS